jgi:hypothetical protein
MSLFGPLIVTDSDVRLSQAQLLDAAKTLDSAVQTCGGLDATTRANWGLFYISVNDAVAKGPGWWADMTQTQALWTQLYTYQQTICAVCQCPILTADPNKPDPATATVLQLARYVMIATVAVGGAYAVGKIAEVLPLGKGRRA